MASLKHAQRNVANVAFIGFCYAVTAIALVALALILWSLVLQGASGLNVQVFTMSTPPQGETGGLLNAMVGSVLMCALGMLFAVVVGVLAGTWLAEYGGNSLYAGAVRFVNDILLSAPSVLVGLFVYYLLVSHVIGHFSGVAGAVALAMIAVPIITRTTEDVLKLQPAALRESGVALGTPYWETVRSILWKSAASGILTGGLLAFARISGETAPLLFTSLGNNFFSLNLLQPMAGLPEAIFNFALSPDPGWQKLGWVGALVIAVAVLGANVLARILTQEQKRS